MGIIDNLFKKPEKDEKIYLNFNQIRGFIEQETEENKKKLNQGVDNFRSRLCEELEKLVKEVGNLSSAEFKPIILEDKRDISKIVETSRRNYCESSKKLIIRTINSLKKTKSPSEQNSLAIDAFNKMNGFSKDALILLRPFKENMMKIASILKEIKKITEEYEDFIKFDYLLIYKEKKILEIVLEIEKSNREREKMIKELKKIEEKLDFLKKDIELKEFELSSTGKSDKSKKIESLKKRQIEIEKEIEAITNKATDLISGISRQIKGYLHLDKVDKNLKSKINIVLETPEKLFSTDFSSFKEVIDKTAKNINKAETDEKRIKKFLSTYKNAEEFLLELFKNYRKLTEEFEGNLKKITELEKEIDLDAQEKELKELKSQFDLLQETKAKLAMDVELDNSEKFRELEELLFDISKKGVKIN